MIWITVNMGNGFDYFMASDGREQALQEVKMWNIHDSWTRLTKVFIRNIGQSVIRISPTFQFFEIS